MGLVSGGGDQALIICHWFVIEFFRHGEILGPTRRCLAAPWREADCPRLNSDGGPLSDCGESVFTELVGSPEAGGGLLGGVSVARVDTNEAWLLSAASP